ncbi:MAG: hypothetical protein A2Z88_02155 [Omnitrophica WOR_2 bacterium GWA2_47_8]|nr:MAG: hypothetical protein A2Z88_02155 [Omnitrophica WOR_2 bacterium GWA2_47_8]
MSNRVHLFWCFIFSIVFWVLVQQENGFSEFRNLKESPIRVAVLNNVSEFTIAVRGEYEIVNPKDGSVVTGSRRLKSSLVTATPNGFKIGEKEFYSNRLGIVTDKDVTVRINGKDKNFRGQMDIVKTGKGKFVVINSLDLERYVQGVLYHEVSHRWPIEAIKAQAVATRTYALYRMKMSADELFDVTSDIYSQVYGGKSAERYRTNTAVERTRGLILIYNNEILPAYFHSNCGGYTEDANELWEEHNIPPLKGRVCPYSVKSPHNSWKKNFRSKDIEEKLAKFKYNTGAIENIAIVARNKSGRIKTLKFTSRDGRVTFVSGKEFRAIIGPNEVKSNNYVVQMKGYYFDLIGKGWGHGVGLCQWGAENMSRQQKKFDEILAFYYPATSIVNMYNAGKMNLTVDVAKIRKFKEEKKKKEQRQKKSAKGVALPVGRQAPGGKK